MKNDLKPVEILDTKEIEEIKKTNLIIDEELMKRRYTSITEDKSRTVKIMIKSIIKYDIETVKKEFLELIINNLHPNLSINDIKEDSYYRTSGKLNKAPFNITAYNDDLFEVTWYTEKQKFIKQIKIYSSLISSKKTVIRYTSIVIGMESVETYFEKRIKNVYVKRDQIAFNIDILKLKMKLNIIKQNKHDKVNKQIERMIKFSKSIY